MNFYDHIDDYISKRLDPELESKMKEAINKSPELRQAIAEYPVARMIAESVKEDETKDQKGKSGNSLAPWIIAATFIAAMIVSVYQWNRYHTEQAVFAETISELYRPLKNMGVKGNAKAENIFEQAINLHQLGEYEKSNLILEDIAGPNADFIRANNYFLLGKYRRSLSLLKDYPKSVENYEEAIYLQALCYKVKDDPKGLKKLLSLLKEQDREKILK